MAPRDSKDLRDVFKALAPGLIMVAVGGYISFKILQNDVQAQTVRIERIETNSKADHERIEEIHGWVKVLLDRSERSKP